MSDCGEVNCRDWPVASPMERLTRFRRLRQLSKTRSLAAATNRTYRLCDSPSSAVSLLRDMVALGGSARVIDSKIYAAWPDWSGIQGRADVASALQRARRQRPLTERERRVVRAIASGPLRTSAACSFLGSARVWLEPTDSHHPSGYRYSEFFAAALRYWNMPYGSREGRSRRFVLVAAESGSHPIAVGLIEVGDDAPYSAERDRFLGLRMDELWSWLHARTDLQTLAGRISTHFLQIRSALLPTPGIDAGSPRASILTQSAVLEDASKGRSRSTDDLILKKRVTYLLRLARGEEAFHNLSMGGPEFGKSVDMREGVRAIHNLVVPRVHLEATVCGALPPFSQVLGGKLVASFLAHPQIIAVSKSPPGAILRDLFDTEALMRAIPHWGTLAMTTRGLYPRPART